MNGFKSILAIIALSVLQFNLHAQHSTCAGISQGVSISMFDYNGWIGVNFLFSADGAGTGVSYTGMTVDHNDIVGADPSTPGWTTYAHTSSNYATTLATQSRRGTYWVRVGLSRNGLPCNTASLFYVWL